MPGFPANIELGFAVPLAAQIALEHMRTGDDDFAGLLR